MPTDYNLCLCAEVKGQYSYKNIAINYIIYYYTRQAYIIQFIAIAINSQFLSVINWALRPNDPVLVNNHECYS